MQSDRSASITGQALALRQSHPLAPARDVLDLVFQGVPVDGLTFPESTTAPASPFGQIIAAAFDRGMSPDEWLAFTGPAADPKLRAACLQVWVVHVLPRLFARFGLES